MIANIMRVLSANGIVAIIGLASSLFMPKILSIEDYAKYQTFILYLSYIAVLHLGFPSGMNIKYAGTSLDDVDKAQYKSEMNILFILLLFFTAVMLAVYAVSRRIQVLYVALMIFPYCYLGSFGLLLQAWQRFREYSFLHVLTSAVSLLAPLLFYLANGRLSGDASIVSYIAVYYITTLYFLFYYRRIVQGVKGRKILSRENWEIEKLGVFFLLGNYINALFHSIDKQFISWFFGASEFSYYSFALTMQSTMTIFITAVAQPLFPYMASGKMDAAESRVIKRYLFALGSLGGLAYFACEFIVTRWIPNYVNSLEVIRIYFAVFPAMAVITCLYFNLYKTKKMNKRYVVDLTVMLVLAAIANSLAVLSGHGYLGVSFVTTLLYYIWLVYGSHVFPEMRLDLREVLFLIAFLAAFAVVPSLFSDVTGFLVYLLVDGVLCFAFFRRELMLGLGKLVKKFKKDGHSDERV